MKKVVVLTITIFFIIGCTNLCKAADTWYVDAINGDNEDDGETREEAWKTITHAVGESGGGDTIIVLKGTYAYNISDPPEGESFPITLDLYTGGRTIRGELRGFAISVYSAIIDASGNPDHAIVFHINRVENVIIENLKITGGGGSANSHGGGIHIFGNNSHDNPKTKNIQIKNNYITNNESRSGAGIKINGMGTTNYTITIEGNYIKNNALCY